MRFRTVYPPHTVLRRPWKDLLRTSTIQSSHLLSLSLPDLLPDQGLVMERATISKLQRERRPQQNDHSSRVDYVYLNLSTVQKLRGQIDEFGTQVFSNCGSGHSVSSYEDSALQKLTILPQVVIC